MKKLPKIVSFALVISLSVVASSIFSLPTQAAEESGSVGVEGKISAPPPSQAATITLPRNGAVISDIPITVSGICPGDVQVKIFKNNVFAGSAQCTNGSYSVQIDLFAGTNELVARVFDDLDQQGPDSNKVTVNYPVDAGAVGDLVSLSSSFAKRGADPGKTLTWPIILSGGTGPYAITVDWGDGKTTDVLTQEFAGTFNIEHIYDSPGIYTIIVRAADKNGNVAFLQLIGVSNGAAAATTDGGEDGTSVITQTRILWQPLLIIFPLLLAAFWLGKRHELQVLRKRLERK